VLHHVRRERVDELARVGRERGVREGVPWVGFQTGVYDFLDIGRAFERPRHRQRVQPVGFHAEVQSLGSALGEPAIVRAGDCSNCVLEETEFGCEDGVVGGEHKGPHDDVRVAVDVFREAVEDDVGTKDERRAVEWGEERVVYED